MRLLLHIGRPKTGTTSLQRFLYLNRDALSAKGFMLFDGVGAPNNIDFAAYFAGHTYGGLEQWCRRRGLESEEDKAEFFASRNFLADIDKQIHDGSMSHHTAIVTSEQLVSALTGPDVIAELAQNMSARFDSVTVVCFVRNQVEVLPSAWSMFLRSGGSTSFRKFIADRILNPELYYPAMAEKWVEQFGQENTFFHVYRGDPEWDIRKYFSDLYLGGQDNLSFPRARANPAYGWLEAQFVRVINRWVPLWLSGSREQNPRNLQWRKRVARIARRHKKPLKLTKKQALRVESIFAESNRYFVEKYLSPGESI